MNFLKNIISQLYPYRHYSLLFQKKVYPTIFVVSKEVYKTIGLAANVTLVEQREQFIDETR